MKSPQNPVFVWQQPGWPKWEFDVESLAIALAQARQQQGIVMGKAEAIGFGNENLTQVVNEIWVQEVLATAAIEGQKLDLDAVRSSVMRQLGIAVGGAASLHIDGLVEVMHDASEHYADTLSADRLCRWQSALFPGGTSGIRRIEVGAYRTFQEPMEIISGRAGKEVVHFRAPNSAQVPVEMARFLAWFNQPSKTDGIIRAAIAHLWFETIHPFEDGNGRLGRTIIDMAIAQDTRQETRLYCMSRQMQENRKSYYDALNHAQRGNLNITGWILWFVTQFSAACQKSGRHIDKAIEKSRFWSSLANNHLNGRQRKTLQKLLDAGDEGFLGGLTAAKYCQITGSSKATATLDLADLVEKNALVSRGVLKATKYVLNVPGWKRVAPQ